MAPARRAHSAAGASQPSDDSVADRPCAADWRAVVMRLRHEARVAKALQPG